MEQNPHPQASDDLKRADQRMAKLRQRRDHRRELARLERLLRERRFDALDED